MPLSKEADAARKRQARADARAAREAEKAGKDAMEAEALAEICPPDMEPDMDVMEAIAAMNDEDKQAMAEAAMSRRMAARYASASVWACIIYPDSAPPDWEDKLRMTGLRAAASPIHDKDTQKDGSPKKPHYHVILQWDAKASYKTAASVSKGTLRGTLPIPLASPRGYYRYFCHLDNPNKARYNEADIVRINGFDPGDFLDLTASEKLEIKKHVIQMILDNDITEYADLTVRCMYNEPGVVLELVTTNTLFFQGFLASIRAMEKAD